MKLIAKKIGLLLFLVVMTTIGCRSEVTSEYNPNEFTLMVAASNHGEVGPCG